jgi:restriction system protein
MGRALDAREVDRALLVTPTRALAQQWRSSAVEAGFEVTDRPSAGGRELITITTTASATHKRATLWDGVPSAARWLLIFDTTWSIARIEMFAADSLSRFPGSRSLFITGEPPRLDVEERYEFGREFFARDALTEPTTQQHLQLLTPSFGLLKEVQKTLVQIDDLSWRQFENLIAQMLARDGYVVELMQGTKDGGVDVIAVKDLGDVGLFKSVWQAKKHRVDRKIGLSLVRELADTRLEHNASKAIIVTTSYLTSGALQRVERDRFLLGKVDRDDLSHWIERTLRG